jgi:hypothetical protein
LTFVAYLTISRVGIFILEGLIPIAFANRNEFMEAKSVMPHEEYSKVVEHIEEPLGLWAKRSFEPFSPEFVDGGNYHQYYADQYADSDHRPRIENRTPLQIERDRVLYSGGMRKLTEKYHVLYSGDRRITRNFTTHTMRMAQVARAISNGLKLNADFAEAIALGAKVGAPPFVHASKHVVAKWLRDRLEDLDKEETKTSGGGGSGRATEKKLFFDTAGDSPLPGWLSDIQSKKIADAIRRFIPFAVGKDVDEPYSSGSEGYWNLATDPYLVQSRPNRFAPETMFGIWRHSLSASLGPETFLHRIDFEVSPAQKTQHQIRWDHVTYEALVVRYADDMTWVIENLDDAHRASALASGSPMYNSMHEYLREQGKVPPALTDALLEKDSGSLYNYFITDFIASSREILNRLKGRSRLPSVVARRIF